MRRLGRCYESERTSRPLLDSGKPQSDLPARRSARTRAVAQTHRRKLETTEKSLQEQQQQIKLALKHINSVERDLPWIRASHKPQAHWVFP